MKLAKTYNVFRKQEMNNSIPTTENNTSDYLNLTQLPEILSPL